MNRQPVMRICDGDQVSCSALLAVNSATGTIAVPHRQTHLHLCWTTGSLASAQDSAPPLDFGEARSPSSLAATPALRREPRPCFRLADLPDEPGTVGAFGGFEKFVRVMSELPA